MNTIDIADVSKTEVRLTPTGFCWTIAGRRGDDKAVEVAIHFDFLWFKTLAANLRRVLALREQETEAAKRSLTFPD